MKKNPMDLKKVLEWLSTVLRCPICSNKYNIENTKVVETQANTGLKEYRLLLHSDCSECKSSVIFNIEINGPEIYSVGMVTDLTKRDSTKFAGLGPISTNEVIEIHTAIQSFDGNFVKAIQGTKKSFQNK